MSKKQQSLMLAEAVFLFYMVTSVIAQGHVFVKAAPSSPWMSTSSTEWVDIPDMIVVIDQLFPGNMSIGFSAEVATGGSQRMFVRALIDGQTASPSDVLFSKGGQFPGTASFRFESGSEIGEHEVKMQWLMDPGGTGYLADRTMFVTTAPGLINTFAAPSGPDVTTTSSTFVDIPDLVHNINAPEEGDAVITVTGEAETSGNYRMFLRALIDGQPVLPSDVVYVLGTYATTHEFTFMKPQISSGMHSINTQWNIDPGGTAYMGDRTVTMGLSRPDAMVGGNGGIKSISAPSGPDVTTTSTSFEDIPDLNTFVSIPENGTLVVSLTAEANASTGKRLFVRAMINDEPMQPSDVVFATDIWNGTRSFHFVRENIPGGEYSVHLQWLTDPDGTAYMGDRNMTIIGFSAPGTAVDDESCNGQPQMILLEQNYPNPFNASTTIYFTLPERCYVTLKVYNIKGSVIETLFEGEKNVGEYTVTWNADDIPTGVYLCRLEAGGFVKTRKLLLQK